MTSYTFVLDANGKQLVPTKEQKLGFLFVKSAQYWLVNIQW